MEMSKTKLMKLAVKVLIGELDEDDIIKAYGQEVWNKVQIFLNDKN